jgi:hypothetical protein
MSESGEIWIRNPIGVPRCSPQSGTPYVNILGYCYFPPYLTRHLDHIYILEMRESFWIIVVVKSAVFSQTPRTMRDTFCERVHGSHWDNQSHPKLMMVILADPNLVFKGWEIEWNSWFMIVTLADMAVCQTDSWRLNPETFSRCRSNRWRFGLVLSWLVLFWQSQYSLWYAQRQVIWLLTWPSPDP